MGRLGELTLVYALGSTLVGSNVDLWAQMRQVVRLEGRPVALLELLCCWYKLLQ